MDHQLLLSPCDLYYLILPFCKHVGAKVILVPCSINYWLNAFISFTFEKIGFLPMRKQRGRSPVTAKLISAFVFAIQIVQFLFFLNPKFQASSLLL